MKYAQISNTARKAFIQKVSEKSCTIRQAAKQFGIKFSTAKAILAIYRHEGRIGKKQRRQKKIIQSDSQRETQKTLKEEVKELKQDEQVIELNQNSSVQTYLQSQYNYQQQLASQIWNRYYMQCQFYQYYMNFPIQRLNLLQCI